MFFDPGLPRRHSLLLPGPPLSLRQRNPRRHFRTGLAAEKDGEKRIVGAHEISPLLRLTDRRLTLDLMVCGALVQRPRLIAPCVRFPPAARRSPWLPAALLPRNRPSPGPGGFR